MKSLKQFEMDIDERLQELCDTFRKKSSAGEDVDFAEYTRYGSPHSYQSKISIDHLYTLIIQRLPDSIWKTLYLQSTDNLFQLVLD